MKAKILGTGRAVPARVLTNQDLEHIVDTTDEWITTRTGIKRRYIAAPEEALTDLAVPASQQALEMAGVDGSEVDLVICATVTPDMTFPAAATQIQDRIGAKGAAAFDVSAACTGFIYALSIAQQFLENGGARTALIIGGEVLSKFIDWTDRSTCVLFGDGAGAAVLRAEEDGESGVLGTVLHSDGCLGDLIYRPGGGSKHPPSKELDAGNLNFIKMRGNETFRVAVRSMAEVSREMLEKAGLAAEDVRWFIPHQANLRIIDAVRERLDVPEERVYVNVKDYGNTSAASIPIALDELNRNGKLDPGDLVLFAAFGAGLTWGAGAVRW
ncbi:MAG: beta-ketoacyl-ACP synthase III [Thermoanaerobaculia bacterium]